MTPPGIATRGQASRAGQGSLGLKIYGSGQAIVSGRGRGGRTPSTPNCLRPKNQQGSYKGLAGTRRPRRGRRAPSGPFYFMFFQISIQEGKVI